MSIDSCADDDGRFVALVNDQESQGLWPASAPADRRVACAVDVGGYSLRPLGAVGPVPVFDTLSQQYPERAGAHRLRVAEGRPDA